MNEFDSLAKVQAEFYKKGMLRAAEIAKNIGGHDFYCSKIAEAIRKEVENEVQN